MTKKNPKRGMSLAISGRQVSGGYTRSDVLPCADGSRKERRAAARQLARENKKNKAANF